MSSIPDIAQSDTLDDYIAHYARHDLEPAAQAVRVHRPAHFLHIDSLSGEKRHTVVEPVGTSGWSLVVAQSYRLIIARRSEEHTSELQSLMRISYAVFCLKKK